MTPPHPRPRYLDVVKALAHQPRSHGLPETPYLVAGITFSDVAEAMGVTRPALYGLWETQYDFWVDLSRFVAFEIDYSQPEDDLPWKAHGATAASRSAAEPGPTIPRDQADLMIARTANAAQTDFLADTNILFRAAAIGYPDIADLGWVRQQLETMRIRSLSDDVELSLAALGRQTVVPHRESEIAASMWCVADGLSVLNHFVPELGRTRLSVDFEAGECSWSLFALAVRALIMGFTSPRSDGEAPSPHVHRYAANPPSGLWSEAQLDVLRTAGQLFLDSVSVPRTGCAANVLGYVSVARVASAAGVSRRTIYNTWPTRAAMMNDLLNELLVEQNELMLSTLDTASRDCDLGRATNAVVGPVGVLPAVEPVQAFLLDLGNETSRSAIRAAKLEMISQLAQRLDAWLVAQHRRPRPGVSVDHLAVIWLSLVRGGHRLRRSNPANTTTFDTAAEVIMTGLTVAEQPSGHDCSHRESAVAV